MKSHEYFLIEAENQMPAMIEQEDMVEVIANMTAAEYQEWMKTFEEYNHIGTAIHLRGVISRQYSERINEMANDWWNDYLEMLKEDQIEQRYEDRRNAA